MADMKLRCRIHHFASRSTIFPHLAIATVEVTGIVVRVVVAGVPARAQLVAVAQLSEVSAEGSRLVLRLLVIRRGSILAHDRSLSSAMSESSKVSREAANSALGLPFTRLLS
jgi:hypothetical protein